MKILFFIFILILYSYCTEFTLKAGTKTDGYCEQGDYIFSFENSFYLNNKSPKEKYEFKLLMDKNIISTCKTKKRNLSNKFEIICKIKKYKGCYENVYFNTPKLGNLEPEKIIFKNGDIILFEGFKENETIQKEKNDKNKNKNKVDITLNAGSITKNIDNIGDIDINKKQFFIIENELSDNIHINDLNGVKFNIDLKVDNNIEKIKTQCSFYEIEEKEKNAKTKKINIKCVYPNLLEFEPETIYILNEPDNYHSKNINIEFNGFKEKTFYTIILGKIEKVNTNSNKFSFTLKNTRISKFLIKNKVFSLFVSINEEEKESKCRLLPYKNNFNMHCYITNYPKNGLPATYNIIYKKPNYFDYSLLDKNTIYFKTDEDISALNLKEDNIIKNIKETVTNIYIQNIKEKRFENNKFIFILNYDQIIESTEAFKLYFNTREKENIESNCVFEDTYIKCESNDESLKEESDVIIKEWPEYITLNTQTIYFDNKESLETFNIIGGKIQKLKCVEENVYQFNLIQISIPDGIPKESTFTIDLQIITNDKNSKNSTAVCSVKNKNCKIEPISCESVLDVIFGENIKFPNQTFSEPVNFYGFNNLRTYTIKAGKLNKGICNKNSDSKIEYSFNFTNNTNNYNKDVSINIELSSKNNLDYKTISGHCDILKDNNIISCIADSCLENENEDIIIINSKTEDYLKEAPNTLWYEGFKGKSTITIKNEGMIIKEEFKDNKISFHITDNILEEVNEDKLEMTLKLLNNKTANCIRISSENLNNFTFSCVAENMEENDEIEIIEEPEYNGVYYFAGYKNKKTLTVKAGQISLKQSYLKIINNRYSEEISEIKNEITTHIKYYNNIIEEIKCRFKNKDINCILKEYDGNIGVITIIDNFKPVFLDDSKNITLNFINFKNLMLNRIELGKLAKVTCSNNIYQFTLQDTILAEKISQDKTLNLLIKINDVEQNCICTIRKNILKFPMTCKIPSNIFKCPSENYNILIENNSFIDDNSLSPDSIYVDIKNNISITTLIPGYIKKENCKNGVYKFNILENKIIGNISKNETFEFKILLTNLGHEGSCLLNTLNSNLNLICSVNIEETSKYCTNINNDIKINSINDYIIVNDNLLYLNAINNLQTITVEAGELEKGDCNKENIYEFKFINSILYNNETNETEINFPLKITQPISVYADCVVILNSGKTDNLDIICKIKPKDNKCEIYPPDKDLTIGYNPGYKNVNSKVINFQNFFGKTTIISVIAGNLSRDEYNKEKKEYTILFNECTIGNEVSKNYTFKIKYELNGKDGETNCNTINSKNIKCIINNVESNNVNLKILEDPIDDFDKFSDKKTITFKNFQNKEIKTFIAGKLNKGKCIDKIYEFNFTNSTSTSILSNNSILLNMSIPTKLAICNNSNISANTLYCVIEGVNTCPVSEDMGIEVREDPNPIQLNDSIILYFSSFSGKSAKEYTISVGNLLKSNINKETCKYYFEFSEIITNISVSFSFDILFNNNTINKAHCSLDNNSMKSSCYFILNESYCISENLKSYDLKIGEKVDIEVDDYLYNINIKGLENLKTVTIIAGNIFEKDIKDKKAFFSIKNNLNMDIFKDVNSNFNLNFTLDINNDEEKKISANCSYIENNEIKCEANDDSLTKDSDIIIKEVQNYLLNENITIYFEKFVGLRTYTVKGGQIQKYECNEIGQDYQFRILNTLSYSIIPEVSNIELNIKINNTENKNTAICTLAQSNQYHMNCKIEGLKCVDDIQLSHNDTIDIEKFKPNTIFFKDFNNKKTITIKAGKLLKGKLYFPLSTQNEYYFSFENNTFTYPINKSISFDLNVESGNNSYTAKCELNSTKEENIILCSIKDNNILNDDIKIVSNPSAKYNILYPDSIFFTNFVNKNITMITMNDSGKIIKEKNNEENKLSFTITDNSINDKNNLKKIKDLEIKILNAKEKAKCNITKTENPYNFDIKCNIINMKINEEIIIEENPIYENYYFVGYKGKRTLTLQKGSIEKNDNKNFTIVKNEFQGDIPEILDEYNKNLIINIKYNNETINKTSCALGEIYEKYIDIKCRVTDEIGEIKTFNILDNPEAILFTDKITLNFINYENSSLNSLTLGKILKDTYNQDSFVLYFVNTTIYAPIKNVAYFNLPAKINDNDNKEIRCQIQPNAKIFKMYCVINNYCPTENIDIKIEKYNFNKKFPSLNLNTININITENITSTTLKIGYLKKIICSNNIYTFTINGNTFNNQKIDIEKFEYKLNMSQFENEALCSINKDSLISTCSFKINEENLFEKSYCENIYQDIKVQNIIGNNYYVTNEENIVNFYGFDKLETFTVVAGDLNRGICNENIYEFAFSNSIIYNNLSNQNEKTFSLYLKNIEKPVQCILPEGLTKENIFDIKCSYKDEINCPTFLDKDLEVASNPNDILSDLKRVNFKNFINKSTKVTIEAGLLNLEKELDLNNNTKYYLKFSNSKIDYNFTEDFIFNLKYILNGKEKKEKCTLIANSTDIICEINDLEKNEINIYIKIIENPIDNYNYFDSKTIIFTNFQYKQIYTFIAGNIQKGFCSNTIYTFYFNNSKCYYKEKLQFYLNMEFPNKIANCTGYKKYNESSDYDVICTMEGTSTCPVEEDEDVKIIADKNEPTPYRINETLIIYYYSFAGQTSDNYQKYYISRGVLTKNSVKKNNNEVIYSFIISDCELNEHLVLNEDHSFKIDVKLNLYETDNNKEFKEVNCTIKNGEYEMNTLFNIECTFSGSSLVYREDDNYDIQIMNIDKSIYLEENIIIYINIESGLETISLHSCELLKGKIENEKYLYTFTNCILPEFDNMKLSFEKLEFTLYTKNNKLSNCILNINSPNTIQCSIANYNENYIEIGDNYPNVNYTKYDKNFYISGLNGLSVNTLNAGELILGDCKSNENEFSFTFKTSQIAIQLSSQFYFILNIKNPLETIANCTIPINSKSFDLKCIIKGENECPVNDKYSLEIEEITEERREKINKKNSIYLNNFKNREKINIIAGNLYLGVCEGNKYKFSFIKSEFKGEGLDKVKEFSIDLKNPKTKAICNIDIDNKIINCYIEGNDECPMYIYTYLETGENNPSTNESIENTIIQYTNFINKKIDFPNYYISISESQNNECINDNYKFDLIANYISLNIPEKEVFYLNLTNNKIAECTFPESITIDTPYKINCIINESIDTNLSLTFDKIYLKEKNIYIINQGKKSFEFKNVECPLFFHNITEGEIKPENTSSNSFNFIILMKTSYKDKKEIKIYNSKNEEKKNNILDFNLTGYSNSSNKFLLFENILKEEENFYAECIVPNETSESLNFNCSINNINDNKSDYFELKDTNDIIKIGRNIIKLKGIEGIKVQNIFKSDEKDIDPDDSSESDDTSDSSESDDTSDSSESDDPTPSPEPDNPDDGKKKGGMSTAAKVILIIVIILIVIIIVLVLLYFLYFKNKDESNSESSEPSNNKIRNSNNNNIRNSQNNNNQNPSNNQPLIKNKKDEQEEEEVEENEEGEENENLKKKKKKNIKGTDELRYEYN